jgi:hypothetical protein
VRFLRRVGEERTMEEVKRKWLTEATEVPAGCRRQVCAAGANQLTAAPQPVGASTGCGITGGQRYPGLVRYAQLAQF